MRRVLVAIALAGAVGGLANALLSSEGLVLPALASVQGSRVLVPGAVGNILIGAIVAVLSYGMYGPLAGRTIIGHDAATDPSPVRLTLAALTGAILVGYSGGRWMTAEAERSLAQGTASEMTQVVEREVNRSAPSAFRGARTLEDQQVRAVLDSIGTGTPKQEYENARRLRQLLDGPVPTEEPSR